MKNYKLINQITGLSVCALSSAVYLMTMEPTASFWDCSEFIISGYKLEVGHPPGAPFFMLTANLFTQLTSDPAMVAMMVNAMSALFSGLTILFLFWSITHMARRIIVKESGEISLSDLITIQGCGLVGALVYTFSDTFWFSAVEAEVYAYSSLFTAVVFWLILKWEEVADQPQPHADRWIVLIAYLTGLSIGVHLLNLLCIPAIVLVYYYRKYPNPTMKGTCVALLVSFAIVGLMMYGVVQGLVEVCGWFELLFVNVLGMPYNSGVYAYIIVLGGLLVWSVYETMRRDMHVVRMKLSFILSIVVLGIPFIGSGYLPGILLIVALTAFLFYNKKVNIRMLNTILVSLMVIVIGYSSYALILIRSSAGTPMDENSPKDIFTLRTYLAREQYGETPLFYGPTYVSELKWLHQGDTCIREEKSKTPVMKRVFKKDPTEKDRYYVSRYSTDYAYADGLNMLFTRMYSSDPAHISAYKQWGRIMGTPVSYTQCGKETVAQKPTFLENLRFFFSYQLKFMYWRYFMWNFSGRQNDIQGYGNVMNGNWITGIKPVDTMLVGPQADMPADMADNKGHNVYYMLPLLLGIIGLLYQAYAGEKGIRWFWVTFFLFFMTGIAIVLYLNQTPYQARERDYAYAGSFYAFCIWIGFGVAALARFLEKAKLPPVASAAVSTLACLFVPVQMASQNWNDHDRSSRYVARDFGANFLESCEPDAIIFTNGDNDTFPLWYNQEVEGVRTDVRVCNTSYLSADWYIDQMKRQAYESAPLPISWSSEQYVSGKREGALVFDKLGRPLDLKVALDFIRSDDERYKRLEGYPERLDFIPSKTLYHQVDTTAVRKHRVLREEEDSLMLRTMPFELVDAEGNVKQVIGKRELMILEILQNSNWERPVYYAVTNDPDMYLGLDVYFRQTGLANRIVPINAKGTSLAVDTDKMFDNVMNKFRWGGVDNPDVYLDRESLKLCRTMRMEVFGKLVAALIDEGKNDKALQTLDFAMKVIPPATVPLDYFSLPFGEYYYQLGQNEKAEHIYDLMATDALRNLNWFFRLNTEQFASVLNTVRENLIVLQEIMESAEKYNPGFARKYKEESDLYRMAFVSLLQGK